jgi:hypothetical protein
MKDFQAQGAHAIPGGYVYRGCLFEALHQEGSPLAPWRFLIWGNVMALLPLAAVVVVVWLPYQFYVGYGTPLARFENPSWSWPTQLLVGGGLLALLLLGHELLHGLALHCMGYTPRFGFEDGMFLTGLPPHEFLPRNHYLVMALAPFLLLTVGGGIALLFLPALPGQLWLTSLLLHAAGSVGDWLVVNELRRWPPEALFADGGSIQVFMPE